MPAFGHLTLRLGRVPVLRRESNRHAKILLRRSSTAGSLDSFTESVRPPDQDGRMSSEAIPAITDSLRDEYTQMLVRLERSRDRARRLRELADQASEQVADDERLLRALAEVLGESPQSSLSDMNAGLRGQRLREVAVEVLVSHAQPGKPIHYRDWYRLVSAQGCAVAGKDPLATFLAQVTRAPEVEAVGRRTGLYMLRAA